MAALGHELGPNGASIVSDPSTKTPDKSGWTEPEFIPHYEAGQEWQQFLQKNQKDEIQDARYESEVKDNFSSLVACISYLVPVIPCF